MNRSVLVALSVLAIPAVPGVTLAETGSTAELAERYREWIEEEVAPILSEAERDAFLELQTDDARDGFMAAFWLARDPTPGTPHNEYKTEYFARVEEADREFGTKSLRGWRTDRGRIYVQLGRPSERIRFAADRRVYPAELWIYRGNVSSELPGQLHLVFYRPFGGGDYELYDPVGDGPDRLISDHGAPGRQMSAYNEADRPNYEGMDLSGGGDGSTGGSGRGQPRRRAGEVAAVATEGPDRLESDPAAARRRALTELALVDPLLRGAAMSPDPAAQGDIRGGFFDPAAARLFARLNDLAEYLPADRSYLDRSGGQPRIQTDFRFRDFQTRAAFHGSAEGGGVVHYAIEVAPASLQLQALYGRATGALHIVGRLFDLETEAAVLEIDETVELALSNEQIDRLRSFPLAVVDAVPLLPGSYEARLQIRNLASGEVGLVTGEFEVPRASSKTIDLGPILLARAQVEAEVEDGVVVPFQRGAVRLLPAGDGILPTTGELVAAIEASVPASESRAASRAAVELAYAITTRGGVELRTGSARARVDRARGVAVAVISERLDGLDAGHYRLRVALTADPAVVRTVDFELAASGTRPPWLLAVDRDRRATSMALLRAEQHLALGDEPAAVAAFEAIIARQPAVAVAGRERLGQLHLESGDYVAAIATLEPLAAGADASPYALLLLGLARSGAGDATGAIAVLERAARGAPDSTDVFNLLGEERLRAGDRQGALAAFRQSLEIEPTQPNILGRVEDLQRQ